MSQVAQCDTGANIGTTFEVVLHPKAAKETTMIGLNNVQLPGWTTEQITYDPFDQEIAGVILGGLSYQPASMSVFMLSKNKAQEELRVLSKERTRFSDIWIKYGEGHQHFWALDMSTDPCGFCGIADYSPQSVGRNDIQQIQFTLVVNGASGMFEYHTPELAYAIAAGVVTAADGDFVNRGFKKGMTLIMETGDQTNPFVRGLVAEVTETTITLTDTAITEDALTGQIHGAVVKLEE